MPDRKPSEAALKAAEDVLAAFGWPKDSRAAKVPGYAGLIDTALAPERERAARMEAALVDLLRHCEDYWSGGSDDFEGFDPDAKKPHPYAKAARAALGKGGA
ncbi:MAG: hypothetical protein ACHQ1G_05815 [Planctomycetota bacterium]